MATTPTTGRRKKRPASPEAPLNADPIRRKTGRSTDKQIATFVDLDPVLAQRALDFVKDRTATESDLDDMDEILTFVEWGEEVNPWLEFFLVNIHADFFGPKLYLIESAIQRHKEEQEENRLAMERIEKENAAAERKRLANEKKAVTATKKAAATTKRQAKSVTTARKATAKKAPVKKAVTTTRKTATPKAPAKAAAKKATPRKAAAK